MIENYLLEFGKSMGIQNLAFGEKGCIRFDFKQDGTIYIERFNEEIFFYILKDFNLLPIPYEYYREALLLAENQEMYSFIVQAIAKGDQLLGFFVRMPEVECDLTVLNKMFNLFLNLIKTLDTRAQKSMNTASDF